MPELKALAKVDDLNDSSLADSALCVQAVSGSRSAEPLWALYDTLESGDALHPAEFCETLKVLQGVLTPREDASRHLVRNVCLLCCSLPCPYVTLHWQVRFARNNFGVQTAECLHLVAQAISPQGAMVNHACARPNVVCSTRIQRGQEPLQFFVCNRRVMAGEEIRHAYFQLEAPVTERRKKIHSVYRFWCSCSDCSSPNAALERLLSINEERGDKILDLSNAFLRQSLVEDDLNRAVPLARQAVQLRRQIAAEEHSLVVSALIEVVKLLLLTGRLEEAISDQQVICTSLLATLGQNHPLLGLQQQMLAELSGRDEDAKRAYNTLCACYGSDHPLCGRLATRMSALNTN